MLGPIYVFSVFCVMPSSASVSQEKTKEWLVNQTELDLIDRAIPLSRGAKVRIDYIGGKVLFDAKVVHALHRLGSLTMLFSTGTANHMGGPIGPYGALYRALFRTLFGFPIFHCGLPYFGPGLFFRSGMPKARAM